jgi:putative addiction module component (TIGR02574 family)
MRSADTILNDALALPVPERAKLVERLLESLDEGTDDPMVDDALAAVIARRLDDLESGKAKVIDAREAVRNLRAEMAKRRAR